MVFYLPIMSVMDKRKPEKRRICHDMAAKVGGKSLNEYIHKPPDIANRLDKTLMLFREHPVTITADVEAFFMRVKLKDMDKDAFRFYFWHDGVGDAIDTLRMTVHIFGSKASSTVATFALRRCGTDHKEEFSEEALKTIFLNFYVDDMLKSVENEEAAIQLVQELLLLLAKGGFKLAKWCSNRKRVLEAILEDARAKGWKDLQDLDGKMDGVTESLSRDFLLPSTSSSRSM